MRHFLQRFIPTWLTAACLMAILCLVTACREKTTDHSKVLLVSIEPLRFVVEAIAGDKFSVQTLMPRGASPETYEPTPRQMQVLSGSRLVFRSGTLGFERTLLEKMAADADGAKIVSLSDGISKIGEDGVPATSADNADPHVWTSPRNLSMMAENVCKALSETDTANAKYYAQRLAAFNKQMDELDNTLRQLLAGAKGVSFLIHHPALGYFAQQYSLHQLAVEQDGKEPSVARLQHIIEQCRAVGVRTAFVSIEHNGRATQRIAEELGVKVTEINPLAYDVPAELLNIAKVLNNESR